MTEEKAKAQALVRASKHFNKLFGIGMNKTGTTSLGQIFERLGYRKAPQLEAEILTLKQLRRGNFQPLKTFVQQYDAFQDLPFSAGVTYAQVDAMFPGSFFILTTRDPEEWYNSLSRFYCEAAGCGELAELPVVEIDKAVARGYRGYVAEALSLQFGATVRLDNFERSEWAKVVARDRLISSYLSRNAEIRHYFANRPDDLLVIDLTREADISRILNFLSLPKSLSFPMPHRRPGAGPQ